MCAGVNADIAPRVRKGPKEKRGGSKERDKRVLIACVCYQSGKETGTGGKRTTQKKSLYENAIINPLLC